MNFTLLALIGVFAFSGNVTPEQALSLASSAQTVSTTTSIALATRGEFTPADSAVKPLSVTVTSYNAVPAQTDNDPHITASGAPSNPEVVAARSVDLKGDLPFGTVIELSRVHNDSENCRFGAVSSQIGYRVIADSMHSRKRQQIDVLLDPSDTVSVHGVATNPALALGFCGDVTVKVIGSIEIKDMPQTQAELAAMVAGKTFAVAK